MVCFPKTFVFAARAFPFAFRTPSSCSSCDAPTHRRRRRARLGVAACPATSPGNVQRDPRQLTPRESSLETRALAEEPAAGDARTARATPTHGPAREA